MYCQVNVSPSNIGNAYVNDCKLTIDSERIKEKKMISAVYSFELNMDISKQQEIWLDNMCVCKNEIYCLDLKEKCVKVISPVTFRVGKEISVGCLKMERSSDFQMDGKRLFFFNEEKEDSADHLLKVFDI